jgi:hypothetical protein
MLCSDIENFMKIISEKIYWKDFFKLLSNIDLKKYKRLWLSKPFYQKIDLINTYVFCPKELNLIEFDWYKDLLNCFLIRHLCVHSNWIIDEKFIKRFIKDANIRIDQEFIVTDTITIIEKELITGGTLRITEKSVIEYYWVFEKLIFFIENWVNDQKKYNTSQIITNDKKL